MDKCINLKKKNFFFAFIFILIFQNLKCNSDDLDKEFHNFCKSATLDRLRQIYFYIETNLKKNPSNDKFDDDSILHILDRNQIMGYLNQYFYETKNNYSNDFNNFKKIVNDTKLFNTSNISDLFSDKMPRNFLINFAINIDKYERIHENKIDGIIDYINYLTNEEIIEYLYNKSSKYKFINDESKFNEIVLNNINISDYNDIDGFYKNKSIQELTDCFYGIKNYYYNVENISNNEVDFYEKEEELKYTEAGLRTLMSLYNISLKDYLKNVDDYMNKVHLRNFKYINKLDFLDMDDEELAENILILEKYYKRQVGKEKSLRGLEKYVKEMPIDKKKKALNWGLLLYPELYIDNIFEDISTSEINLQYGQVRTFIDGIERIVLLKYAYNIHTYRNKINSLYDEKIFNLYRYKNEHLNEIILSDTNSDRDLQLKSNFDKEANLRQDYFNEYLKKLPRNQLKKILNALNSLYYIDISYVEDFRKKADESIHKKEFDFLDVDELYNLAQTNYESCLPKNSKTSEYMNDTKNQFYLNNTNFTGYYTNIIDFLRSTNIIYLKLWLKKFEDLFRFKFSLKGIKGGFKYSFFNEYDKEELLKIFDIYLANFEEYFKPNEFIKIVGLDNDITPHKFLTDLFYSNDTDKEKKIKSILYSLNGYYQRKNLQINFDFNKLIDLLYSSVNEAENYENFLFQFFRIINIFPELNNKELFDIICLNKETRIIFLNDKYCGFLFNKSNDTIKKSAENIQYFLNHTNHTNEYQDNKTISEMDMGEIKIYIENFINNSDSKYTDIELKSKVIDGYFEYTMYDYFENYLNKADENRINFIYKNVNDSCKNYPCKNITFNDNKTAIIENIKTVQEFQDPSFFDKNVDNLGDIKSTNLSKFLMNSTIKDLKYYTILVEIYKLKSYEGKEEDYRNDTLTKFDLHVFTKSRNEMIRYILNESSIFNTIAKNENKTIEEILPILAKYYMLDLGSENIYDLILY